MKIVCTVSEFAGIVRGCYTLTNRANCVSCPFYEVCGDGTIEQFVSVKDITDDDETEVKD